MDLNFDWCKKNENLQGVELSLSFHNANGEKSYEICLNGKQQDDEVKIIVQKMLNEHPKIEFKSHINPEKLDQLVGYALRNGFFQLKSKYQGEVKDNYRHLLKLRIGKKEHLVEDSFGSAPSWVKQLESQIYRACTKGE